jgi:hypothetical protein
VQSLEWKLPNKSVGKLLMSISGFFGVFWVHWDLLILQNASLVVGFIEWPKGLHLVLHLVLVDSVVPPWRLTLKLALRMVAHCRTADKSVLATLAFFVSPPKFDPQSYPLVI